MNVPTEQEVFAAASRARDGSVATIDPGLVLQGLLLLLRLIRGGGTSSLTVADLESDLDHFP